MCQMLVVDVMKGVLVNLSGEEMVTWRKEEDIYPIKVHDFVGLQVVLQTYREIKNWAPLNNNLNDTDTL